MRSRVLLLVGACGLFGCVSFPHARLLTGTIKAPWGDDVGKVMVREVVTGPVVCGPVGFRKVPLQARWGEYVRVTVSAPGALRGSVLVHADGVAQEPRSWNTESDGALVVDARFPNEDVDQRFALERERPIDLTLTGLEGACEGAVFTVEHGALVPSIDERAWIAELERRGGPELAARREAARLEADARRQAHYAQWEARQVEVSAEALAQASLVREAHYAQWEARHAAEGDVAMEVGTEVVASSDDVAVGGSVAVSGGAPASGALALGDVPCASGTCAGQNLGGGVSVDGVVVPAGQNFGAGVATSGGSACVSGTCAGPSVGGSVAASGGSACASGTCAGPNSGGAVVTASGGSACASGTCAGPNVGGGVVLASSGSACVSGSCPLPNSGAGVNDSAPCASGACEAHVTVSPMPLRDTAPVSTVSLPGEWSRPSDVSLRATVDTTWVQPPDAQLRATASIESSWEQPFVEPHLEPVAVTTESRVATVQQPFIIEPHLEPVAVTTESQGATVQQPLPPACNGACARPVDPALSVLVPAMFQVFFNVAASASHHEPAHGAQPISPRR